MSRTRRNIPGIFTPLHVASTSRSPYRSADIAPGFPPTAA